MGIGLALLVGLVLVGPADSLRSARGLLGLAPERLLPAVPVVARGGEFTYSMVQPGSAEPVGWDPCKPIRYQVNRADEPQGGQALIDRALERASAATGLVFDYDGDTDDRPFTDELIQFGDSPVVIGWADDTEFAELTGDVAGFGGGSAPESGSGRRYYVTGGIALDTAAFTDAAIAGAPRVMEALVLHEVAHVVGLAHVNEPMEMMFGIGDGQSELGPGDLEGLARLGSLPCG